MKILAFDTANNTVSVAISEGQKILSYLEDLRSSVQAERLLPMIEQALKQASLSYQELGCVAVTKGPGSFTGIRIALAAAKGILAALPPSVHGVGVSNFEIAYFRAVSQVKEYSKIYTMLNAYRGQLYLQAFSHGRAEQQPQLVDYSGATTLIKQELYSCSGPIICAGNGVSLIHEQLKQHAASNNNLVILPRFARVKAIQICRYVDTAIAAKGALGTIEPLYIRPPDAALPKS